MGIKDDDVVIWIPTPKAVGAIGVVKDDQVVFHNGGKYKCDIPKNMKKLTVYVAE